MVIVIINGSDSSSKYKIETVLNKLDFRKLVKYTTRLMHTGEKNGFEYLFINDHQFDRLSKNGRLVEYSANSKERCGCLKPVGHDKFVAISNGNESEVLKDLYKDQVVNVFLKSYKAQSESTNDIEGMSDLILDDSEDETVNTSYIISYMYEKKLLN